MEGVYDKIHNLPRSWKRSKLGDVLDVIRGASPRPKGDPKYFGGRIPWIMISDVTREKGKYLSQTRDCVTEEGARRSRHLKVGTLILSNSGTVCVPKILAVDGCIHDGFVAFPAIPEQFDVLYLYYYFDYIRPRVIDAHRQGITQVNLNTTIVKNIQLPVPPRLQQEEIVAEIEKQFSRLDEAVANLKRVKANLKRYKASVLKAAVEGKLTEDWRKQHPDVEPASKLLERMLTKTLAKRHSSSRDSLDSSRFCKLPPTWCWSRVEDIGDVQLGRQRAPRYHSGHNMRPYLRVQNVFEDCIDLEDVMEMDFPPADFERYRLSPGDILLNEGQSPELLGRPAIYRGELPDACFTNTLIRFRVNALMTPNYPFLVFRAYMRNGRFTKEGTITTNIAHLSAGRFAKIEFPLPPLKEQEYIVAEVDRRLSIIDKLEATVQANLARADHLRQSILSQAFCGRLLGPDTKHIPDILPTFSIAAEGQANYGKTAVRGGKRRCPIS